MDFELIVALSSLLVSFVALFIALVNLAVADQAARNDVLAQVRDWGGEVIRLMSIADGLCRLDPARRADCEVFDRRNDLLADLSAVWDQGRCFFPNTYRETLGQETDHAYQGLRPEILDLLALAYGLVKHIDYVAGVDREKRSLALIALKRTFVSVIQVATSFDSPKSVKKYERYLSKIGVGVLPAEIRVLAGAQKQGFEIGFSEELHL